MPERLLFDAHNHLQDPRLGARPEELAATARAAGVVAMAVNATGEHDWAAVGRLAETVPGVRPQFGLHPWWVPGRAGDWRDRLVGWLDRFPAAGVGEIGLDRWKPGLAYEGQEQVFLDQWQLACDGNRPASLHVLKAWGRIHELLREHPGPACGFLLHSYGGPAELVEPLVRLGAFFSFPGYFLRDGKERARAVFRVVPVDRLVIETDAPDQTLPDHLNPHPLLDAAGHPLNHPANLSAVLEGLAALRGEDADTLAARTLANAHRLFGG
jgi:TatD DNase family protein